MRRGRCSRVGAAAAGTVGAAAAAAAIAAAVVAAAGEDKSLAGRNPKTQIPKPKSQGATRLGIFCLHYAAYGYSRLVDAGCRSRQLQLRVGLSVPVQPPADARR